MDLAGKPRQFEDSWRRIDRAIAHARVITKQWPTLLDPTAQPKIIVKSDGKYAARVRLKREKDNDLALELGEYFYQLRAALDAVAYRVLVLETGLDPPPRENLVEFPLYDKPTRFENCPLIQETQLPKVIRDWLESIQPYKFAQSSDPTIVELGRLLKALHDCARKDRHRKLHLVVAGISRLKVRFEHGPNVTVSNVEGVPIDFLGDDVDFLTFDATFHDLTIDTTIRLISDVTIELGMTEFPDHIGQDLMTEFERIMVATRHIVQTFEDGYPL